MNYYQDIINYINNKYSTYGRIYHLFRTMIYANDLQLDISVRDSIFNLFRNYQYPEIIYNKAFIDFNQHPILIALLDLFKYLDNNQVNNHTYNKLKVRLIFLSENHKVYKPSGFLK